MKKILLAGFLMWGSSTTLSAQELQQIIIANAFGDQASAVCDGESHMQPVWHPNKPVVVKRVEVWIGTNGGDPFPAVDVYTTVHSVTSENRAFVLAFYGLDHYVSFTGAHQLDKVFPLDQQPLIQEIAVEHMCRAVGKIASQSRTQVIVTFTIPEGR